MIGIFKKFFAFSGKQKKNFYSSLVYAFFLAMFEALRILAVGCMLTAIVSGNMTPADIWTTLGIMLVSILGSAFMRNATVMRQTVGGYTMCADKRVEIGERLKYMPMGYFNDNNLGYITSITTNTAENLQDVATRVIQMYLQGVINTLVITLALCIYDIRVGLVTVAGIIVFFLVNTIMQKVSARISPRKTAADEKIVDAVLEYVQGIGVVKSYQLLGQANQKVSRAIDECERVNFGLEKTFVPFQGVQTFVLKLAGVAMVLTSILLHLNGAMELVSCLLLIISSFMVYAHLETAGIYSALLRVVDLSVDKINGILETPVMDEKGQDIAPKGFDIVGEHVSFSYEQRKILNDVSFTIKENTTTAIVGPSGGGKTTLCNLIARFWDVDEGCITIGGRDVREYKLDHLLSSVMVAEIILDLCDAKATRMQKCFFAFISGTLLHSVWVYAVYFLGGMVDFTTAQHVIITSPNPIWAVIYYIVALKAFQLSPVRSLNTMYYVYSCWTLYKTAGRLFKVTVFPNEIPCNYLEDTITQIVTFAIFLFFFMIAKRYIANNKSQIKFIEPGFFNRRKAFLQYFAKASIIYFFIVSITISNSNQVYAYILINMVLVIFFLLNIFYDLYKYERLTNSNQQVYISALFKGMEEFRGVKHDFFNILHTYSGYLEIGAYDELKEYHNSLVETTEHAGSMVDLARHMSENPTLVSLLLSKFETAEKMNVKFLITIQCEIDDFYISDLDLIRVLSCLLDNAIEAAAQAEDRRIYFTCEAKDEGVKLIIV